MGQINQDLSIYMYFKYVLCVYRYLNTHSYSMVHQVLCLSRYIIDSSCWKFFFNSNA